MITAQRAREVLDYNPETGAFLWKVMPSWRVKLGATAGYVKTNGYLCIVVDGRNYVAQRLAWLIYYGRWPELFIDHINRDRLDNRIVNLREATRSQNQANKPKSTSSASGLKGVRRSPSGRWVAVVVKDRRSYRFGTYDDPTEAHRAYVAGARSLFGEFARTE